MAADLICARCGAEVPLGSRFCPSCGAPQADARREERRIVTVLFGDLAGFTEMSERLDAEEVKALVDATFERLARIVEDHGGRVDKVIGDEIMAVFGAPQAHEDDPERAVRAALAITRELASESRRLEDDRGITLRMHLGVNTGEVVAGLVGGSDAYSVVGDAVNTARRIEDAAEPGQILVGEPTYEATRGAISYRRADPVVAKGKRVPVAVWEAVAERGLPGERGPRRAPLIGRDEEIVLLRSLAAIVRRDRTPTLATLVGDAGLGKSRIAEDFAARAATDGWRVLDGRSLPYGTATPAFEVEELLRAVLGVTRATDGEDRRGELKERLDRYGLAAETDLLAAFLGLGGTVPVPGETPGAAGGDHAGEARAALGVARVVLERVATTEGGLVCVFHDLHWANDAVLDFVQDTLEHIRAPVLIVCLARTDLLERRPSWSASVGNVLLRIRPLPRERAAEMLDLLAPGLAPGMREIVLDRAGGNPFYLEELARFLLDAPDAALAQPSVPVGVQSLVVARLDALAPDLKRVIQDAAVVGDRFWPGALRAAGGDPGDVLDAPALDELIERVPDEDLPGEHGYRFRQTLVREVAYNSVPKNVRASAHRAVGEWLAEAAGRTGVERDVLDLLAHHFERAATLAREVGTPDPDAEARAREYLERAGDRALSMDAARTAARFFERALTVARDDADALGLRLRLGEALVGSFRHGDALEHLEAALREARALGDRAREARALRLMGDSYRMQGQGDRARQPLEQALAIAKDLGDEAEEAAGLRARGQLDLFQGRWQSSILWFRQALARFRALGDRRGEGWSLQNLGWASMFVGRLDDAIAYLRDGEQIFTELGDEEGAGWCVGMRAWVHLLQGEVEEAGRIAEALETYLRLERPEYLLGAGFVLDLQRILRAYVEALRCHFADATRIAHDAMRSGDHSGASWVTALGHYPPFLAALRQRRFALAREELGKGIRGAAAMGDPFYEGLAEFARALLAFEEGNLDEAEQVLEHLTGDDERGRIWRAGAAVAWLRASIRRERGDLAGARDVLLEGERAKGIALISPATMRVLLAEVLTDLGEHDRALAEADGAIAASGEETLTRLLALRARAVALSAAGRPAEAEDAIRDELQVLDETDWTLERIRALAVLARVLDEQRRFDEASETQDQARALLEELPPDVDAEPVRAMLGA